MDLTDRISFSKSSDLAGQNKRLKDPGQVYIAKSINIGRFVDRCFRFLADFLSILGYSGDHLGMIRACFGWFPGMFQLGKLTYKNCAFFFVLSVYRVQKKIVRCGVWFRSKNKC